MNTGPERLRIGSITKPHGLKGAVKVYPQTDELESFAAGTHLQIETRKGAVPVRVRTASRFKNLMIVSFEEFERIEDVEEFRGADLTIAKDDVRELAEDEYFISDLIGLSVSDEEGRVLGEISEVLETGANDVYVVKRDGQPDLLIPAIKDCILEVRTDQGTMTVRLMQGMEQP